MNTLWLLAILGLSASLHCIVMCGPLALALPVGRVSRISRPWLRVIFVTGRWFIYCVMGGLVAMVGKPVSWWGFQEIWLIAGLAVVLAAAIFWEKDFFGPLRQKMLQYSHNITESQPIGGFFVLGIANGLLPCGAVYSALAITVLSGSFLNGAVSMLAFGVATSWWHIVLIFNWRIPRLTWGGFSFLGSPRVALILVFYGLFYRGLHILDAHKVPENRNNKAPTEQTLCRKPG